MEQLQSKGMSQMKHPLFFSFSHSESRPLGTFTDDTGKVLVQESRSILSEMTLALADSITELGRLDAKHCAKNYAHFYAQPPPRYSLPNKCGAFTGLTRKGLWTSSFKHL